jgi:CrcB protein
MPWLMVAIGGALGAMARYWMYNWNPAWQQKAALVTFMVNALGSFMIGAAFVILIEKGGLSPQWRNLVTVGFLGAFTTYSTYSLDALRMLEQGQFASAALYLFGTLLACLVAVWLGMTLTRLVI